MKKLLAIAAVCAAALCISACEPSPPGSSRRLYDVPEYDDDTRTESDRRADEAEMEAWEAEKRAREAEEEAYEAAEEEAFEEMYGSDDDQED